MSTEKLINRMSDAMAETGQAVQALNMDDEENVIDVVYEIDKLHYHIWTFLMLVSALHPVNQVQQVLFYHWIKSADLEQANEALINLKKIPDVPDDILQNFQASFDAKLTELEEMVKRVRAAS